MPEEMMLCRRMVLMQVIKIYGCKDALFYLICFSEVYIEIPVNRKIVTVGFSKVFHCSAGSIHCDVPETIFKGILKPFTQVAQ